MATLSSDLGGPQDARNTHCDGLKFSRLVLPARIERPALPSGLFDVLKLRSIVGRERQLKSATWLFVEVTLIISGLDLSHPAMEM